MKKIILFLFVLALSFSGCEKDDICDANTPTTPRLVIGFYDFLNPSVLKNVTDLKVIGDGMPKGVLFNGAETTSANTISIPLKTVGTTTTYRLTLNSGNSNAALVDEDIIKFDYTTKEVFVSRACGYKSIFTLDPTTPYTHKDPIAANQKWIKFISVEKNNIENENETHIKIFF
ncbi:DUF6452 family protein [Flavobacterium sp. PL12]|uniref:DUF6452 family protein n=1 Tax=Flavobacterium sp. PL12 TaxID=3071718 RepID=UPI00319E5855